MSKRLLLVFGILFYVFISNTLFFQQKALAKECSDVLTVFARGSGQDQGEKEDDLKTKPERVKFFEESEKLFGPHLSFRNQELQYPALGGLTNFAEGEVEWLGDKNLPWIGGGKYRDSVKNGIDNAKALISAEVKNCPEQQIVLGGYSQGGHVMGNVLSELSPEETDNIAYVALFGEPKFNARSFSAKGTFRTKKGGILEPRVEFPDEFVGKVGSWCKMFDGICNNRLDIAIEEGAGTHSTYWRHEVSVAVREAASKVFQHYSLNPKISPIDPSNGPVSKQDVVFVTDSSRSMEPATNSLKTHAEEIADKALGLSEDTKIGLVAFDDDAGGEIGTDFGSRVITELTSNRPEFIEGANTIKQLRKDEWQTHVYWGTGIALKHQPWREDSVKNIILLGDAPPQDPEPITGDTYKNIASLAREKGLVKINAVLMNAPDSTVNGFKPLVDATRGKIFKAFKYTNVFETVISAIESIKTEPVAYLGGPYVANPGDTIHFSAAGSYDPDGSVVKYEWDFDGDGKYDYSSSSPTAQHVYDHAFKSEVFLRVAAKDGGISVNSALVDINETVEVIKQPSKPTNIITRILKTFGVNALSSAQSQTQFGDISVTWDAPLDNGGSEITNYVVYSPTGEVITIVDADTYEVTLVNVPLDQGNFIQVSAVNEAGTSLPVATKAFESPKETEDEDEDDAGNDGKAETGIDTKSEQDSGSDSTLTQVQLASSVDDTDTDRENEYNLASSEVSYSEATSVAKTSPSGDTQGDVPGKCGFFCSSEAIFIYTTVVTMAIGTVYLFRRQP